MLPLFVGLFGAIVFIALAAFEVIRAAVPVKQRIDQINRLILGLHLSKAQRDADRISVAVIKIAALKASLTPAGVSATFTGAFLAEAAKRAARTAAASQILD